MSNSEPAVAVIIPCYNLGAYLDQAVQSVLNQTHQDFEILIIDDGSTDAATRHLFASYQRPKTRIFRTKNQGLANARNLGIKEAKGHYISCLDADDQFEPTFLERAVEALETNPSVAFASCWLKAFGDSQFLWNPTTCDFPHLLVEDTVCTAALMRRAAVLEVGGFDPDMPVPGYEDWDLAITLVEHGMHGLIIPEYLFCYRIRPGSMSASCTEPGNHALLMSYLVEKHAGAYKQHLPGVLEAIEKRTLELEGYDRPAEALNTTPEAVQRMAFLENALRSVLQSRSWRLTRPLRDGFGRLQRMTKFINASNESNPRISVVVSCGSDPENLRRSVESLWFLLGIGGQIILADSGSSDPLMVAMLEWYGEAGFEVLRMDRVGATRAREAGLKHARAPVVFAMSAGDALDATAFGKAQEALASANGIVFVSGGIRDQDTGFIWVPQSADLTGFLACPRVTFPMVRHEALSSVGNYDGSFSKQAQADWDLTLRLAIAGERGTLLADPLLSSRTRQIYSGSASADGSFDSCHVRQVVDKHRGQFDRHWMQVVLGHENLRRQLQAQLEGSKLPLPDSSTPKPVDWGGLRRLEPLSRVWGLDRGQPVDRHYIEKFLSQHRDDIHGRVLEVKDGGYTQAYGQGVERSDVVDVAPDNSSATLICDLSARGSLPESFYNCFILTQTMHIIYDIRKVVENAYRTLRSGGVLLATLPCVSRVDYESGLEGDCWRFTPASARQLFEDVFGAGHVKIEAFGNVLVCSSFLMGLSSEDLTPAELNHQDPYFPLLVCVRAVKLEPLLIESGPIASQPGDKALVLLYHRIDRSSQDRWHLCVSPENFAAHLRCLRRCFSPVRLAEIAAMLEAGKIKHGSVAVTFDDGYRDNLVTAMPILKQMRVPATFFISGDAALDHESFWWERLDAALRLMELDEAGANELHRRLMVANVEERNRILDGLPVSNTALPRRLTCEELKTLAREPLCELGAHGWSHRALADLSLETLRAEVKKNMGMLTDRTGLAIRSFAHPFGGPATPDVDSVLREAGIRAACTVVDTAVTAACGTLAIPRLEVKDWNEAEFEARLRSLLGE